MTRICRGCDRGNIYCTADHARQRRRESWRRSSAAYQRTERGRANHAARQARYLDRRELKMTRLDQIIKRAFDKRIISSMDHAVIKRLQGAV